MRKLCRELRSPNPSGRHLRLSQCSSSRFWSEARCRIDCGRQLSLCNLLIFKYRREQRSPNPSGNHSRPPPSMCSSWRDVRCRISSGNCLNCQHLAIMNLVREVNYPIDRGRLVIDIYLKHKVSRLCSSPSKSGSMERLDQPSMSNPWAGLRFLMLSGNCFINLQAEILNVLSAVNFCSTSQFDDVIVVPSSSSVLRRLQEGNLLHHYYMTVSLHHEIDGNFPGAAETCYFFRQ